ncbi:hypothetical protein KSP39_PZI021591 [Platanthera zijinensis]|uniref:Uncharacterized protein n=1 Tax=Platanthera zijinensis TaxID=2320716 RepID=A0AAP0FWC6_9ASPA
MATLTPGVLLTLLQSMNSDSKPLGEHRSAVLQVTGVVPAPSSAVSSDDLWPSHGFYLQLSDSVHSTYVSLSGRDADPQLGQLVHLDRLHFDLPVPRATGLRPISSPRHCPFLGTPEPLIAISSSSSHAPGFENFNSSSSKKPSEPTSISKPKRRFSSPAFRNPSLASPIPSKCEVPSLVAAKEENRKPAREPAIVVPSRYRQPSPVGRKTAAHLLYISKVVAKCRLSDATLDKIHNDEESTEQKRPPSMIDTTVVENPDHMTQKVAVYDRKWTDGSIPLDSVSKKLARLGKDAIERRNIASKAAADALEEALATESLIRSLSMFSDLCLTSKNGNPLRTINNFLSIYNDVVKGTSKASALVARRTENNHVDALSINHAKSASLWVEAALRTDLQVLNLINSSTLENHSKLEVSEKISIPCADFPKSYISKRSSHAIKIQSKSSSTHCSSANIWTLELAESLRNEMQFWFLNFVEGAISVGFFLFGDKEASFKDNTRVAAVVFHLKRVSDWIDVVFGKPEDEILSRKIELVRQKIYNFVMNHMGLMKPISNSWTEVDDGDVLAGMGSAFDRAWSLGNS